MRALDVRRITGLEALLWILATLVPLVLVARAPGMRDAVDAYLAAIERGDADAAFDLLASDPMLVIPLAGPYGGERAARDAIEWRVAVDHRLHVDRVLERDDSDGRLALEVRAESRVLDLLGAEQRYQAHYFVRGGRVRGEMWLPADRAADAAARDSLAAFGRWLDAEHPGDRDALFEAGGPRWTGRTADLWLARLEEWRAGRSRDGA
ncbi:MAG TPA: hypothetical protein VML54_09960 [Candidatus Limnocylindrales bacterium]|nr:hypothetical protein [Candidatus Limnocylindrales bacterium]